MEIRQNVNMVKMKIGRNEFSIKQWVHESGFDEYS